MPYIVPASVEKRMTGPATENILAPTPKINPSLLLSIAALVTAFEKPVTGTKVPAPANLAILSKKPKAVEIDAKIIKVIVTSI